MVVILPSALIVLRVHNDSRLSLIDEAQHVDYLRRVENGEVPKIGDRLLSVTMVEIRCTGVVLRVNAPCPPRGTSRAALIGAAPIQGYSYEAQQPPLYYVATALLRQPLAAAGMGLISSARLTGVVWLVAGLLILYFASRRLRATHVGALLACALVAALPPVLYQSSTVNNDAAAVFAGSSALLMFVWLRDDDRWWPWIVAAGATGVLIWVKPVAIIVFWALAALLFIVRARRDPIRPLLARVLLVAGVPAVAYELWSAIANSRSTVPYDRMVDAITVGRAPAHGFPWSSVPSALKGWGTLDLLYPVLPDAVIQLGFLAMLVLLASGLAAVFDSRRLDVGARVGVTALATLLVAAVAYVWFFYAEFGVQGGAQPRYGLVLVPWLAASLASSLRARRQKAIVFLLVGALVLVEVIALA